MSTIGCPKVDRLGKTNEDYITNLKPPKISKNAAIEVYYTETPLGGQGTIGYKPQPGELKPYGLIYNVNHTGIGFRVIEKNGLISEFVFNLRVSDFGLYILMPHINENSKDFSDLDWCNEVLLTFIPIMDRTYWLKSDYICTITRDDFYALIDWIKGDYQLKRTKYIFLSVIKGINRQDIFNPVRKSYLCDDFCYDVLHFLQENRNIAIQYYTVPDYNIAAFVTDKPVNELDTSKEENRELIYNFYLSIKTIFTDIFNVATALRGGDKENTEKSLEKLKLDLIKFLGEKTEKYISEFLGDLLSLTEDIFKIINSLKINPNNPNGQELIKSWEKFMSSKTMENFYLVIKAFGVYVLSNVNISDLVKIKTDYQKLKGLIPKIMAGFSQIIYYGYTDDYRLAYFLVQGPVGFYANYLEADLYRDLPFRDIHGKIVNDPYTRINEERRLVRNYIPDKYPWIPALFIILIVMVIIILIILKRKK
jgi:hypothetical protein